MREVARPESHADGPKGPAAGGGSPYAGATGGIGGNWRRSLAPLPAVGAALLPKLTCPACWPAYAGVLGALGLGFVNYSAYLFPLTALFLAVAVASLGWRAKSRRGYARYGRIELAATAIAAASVDRRTAVFSPDDAYLHFSDGSHPWQYPFFFQMERYSR